MTPLEGNMAGASEPVDVYTNRQRIAASIQTARFTQIVASS